MPRTPGAIAQTLAVGESKASGMYFFICLVICILFTTSGPRESGVTPLFPSPTTSTVAELISQSSSLFISFPIRPATEAKSSGDLVSSSGASRVMYIPCFLPRRDAASSLVMRMRLIKTSPSCDSSSSIPVISGFISRASAARSV